MQETAERPCFSPSEALIRSYFHLDPLLSSCHYHDDVCFSRDGRNFAVVSDSFLITLFGCEFCDQLGQITNKKFGNTKAIYHYFNDDLYVNSCNKINDFAARIVNIRSQAFAREFIGHTAPITSLCAVMNGVITASQDKTVKIWDDKQEKYAISIDTGSNPNVALHPNGNCLAVTTNNDVNIYDIRKIDKVVANSSFDDIGNNKFTMFGLKGNRFVLYDLQLIQEYEMPNLNILFSFSPNMQKTLPLCCLTPDEDFLLFPNNDYSLIVLDSKGNHITVLSGHNAPINNIAFSPLFNNFVSVGKECLYWTIDITTYSYFRNLSK